MGIFGLIDKKNKLPLRNILGLILAVIFFFIGIYLLITYKPEIHYLYYSYLYSGPAIFDFDNEKHFLIFLGLLSLVVSLLFFMSSALLPLRKIINQIKQT